MNYAFQYETATDVDGESETLEPVDIQAESRADANERFALSLLRYGGRAVRCDSCSDAPLLVGEELCADCADFAKAIVLTPDMRIVLDEMVRGGGGIGFYTEELRRAARDCESNDLATYEAKYQAWTATSLGRAAIDAWWRSPADEEKSAALGFGEAS
jgi:hypothetical protein